MAKKDIKKEALKMNSERSRMSAASARDTRQTAAAKKYKIPKTMNSPGPEMPTSAQKATAGRMQRLAGATERMAARAAADVAARRAGQAAVRSLASKAIKGGGWVAAALTVGSVAKDAYDAGKKLESAMRPTAKSGPATAKGSVQISPEQAAKMKAKDAYPIVRGATAAKMAGKVSEFGQAFAAARKKLGKSGTFEYKGKKYNTKYKGE